MKTLGRYEIINEIGRGAMGIVYLGRDPKIDRAVAIKCLRLDLFEEHEEAKKRFQQEVLALGRLVHANIVTIFDAGEDSSSDYAYIVMEYVPGLSLAQLLKSGEPLSLDQVRHIGVRVCDALDFAHAKGVIHRDIKPGNILLSPDLQTVKVTDFGIARLEGASQTHTHRLLGTPQYMSPEQCNSEPLDGRSDLFAVGALLYELLTKQKAFPGESVTAVMYSVINKTPAEVCQLSPNVPKELNDTVMKALEKTPSARWSCGKEMARALTKEAAMPVEETGSGETLVLPSVPEVGESKAPPRRGKKTWSVALVAIALLSFLGWKVLVEAPESQTPSMTVTQEQGTIELLTDPVGAQILINGEMKGVSPLTINLPAGSHELKVTKAGHRSLEATIDVPAGEKIPLDLKLSKEEISP